MEHPAESQVTGEPALQRFDDVPPDTRWGHGRATPGYGAPASSTVCDAGAETAGLEPAAGICRLGRSKALHSPLCHVSKNEIASSRNLSWDSGIRYL